MKTKIDNIEIMQGDLTSIPLDIIVNAANHTLLGGGGIDVMRAAIFDFQAFAQFFRLHREVATGNHCRFNAFAESFHVGF